MSTEKQSTIYGPVKSWRHGNSLGIDPLFLTSTCSFNCVYCQLGKIQNHTDEVKEYVSMEQFESDIKNFLKMDEKIDVATFSGSGEPTLAINIDSMLKLVKEYIPKAETTLFTNGTTLLREDVRQRILDFEHISVKLDATTDDVLKKINRPVQGKTTASIFEGIVELKKEFKNKLSFQVMCLNKNDLNLDKLAECINKVRPDAVYLNTPKRDYPLEWKRDHRGNHTGVYDIEVRSLKKVSNEDFSDFVNQLRPLLTYDCKISIPN